MPNCFRSHDIWNLVVLLNAEDHKNNNLSDLFSDVMLGGKLNCAAC